jgi:hypothetical protein
MQRRNPWQSKTGLLTHFILRAVFLSGVQGLEYRRELTTKLREYPAVRNLFNTDKLFACVSVLVATGLLLCQAEQVKVNRVTVMSYRLFHSGTSFNIQHLHSCLFWSSDSSQCKGCCIIPCCSQAYTEEFEHTVAKELKAIKPPLATDTIQAADMLSLGSGVSLRGSAVLVLLAAHNSSAASSASPHAAQQIAVTSSSASVIMAEERLTMLAPVSPLFCGEPWPESPYLPSTEPQAEPLSEAETVALNFDDMIEELMLPNPEPEQQVYYQATLHTAESATQRCPFCERRVCICLSLEDNGSIF